ncbi:adenosylmethionine decarboxylase [Xenorhabdus doucetiae]|uniref:S-adenosylmethionine decarboxylase proenzyme n=1 Tax=Xenorhabdus doucetiae TaxID=351671 RepID=A0A068QQQ9_9GAMM|nr:adenosylmethionine decarboxylase [Xenorhabdus doucetiae]TYP00672.1 S-adenosylmethionine decarboxylase [Xenorhabdus doucetiae]CDG16986.1 S-adenosylmethionine decarboxylase proenzyme [Xenorhabdus doucetiae]
MISFNKMDVSGYSFNGKHVLAEFYGVNFILLNDQNILTRIMRSAIQTTGATIINETSHKFNPEGVTVLFLLAESHASIHTYPSHSAAFIDIFTCGNCNPNLAISEIKKALNPTKIQSKNVVRGTSTHI